MSDKQIIVNGIDVSGGEKQCETVAGITCGIGSRANLAKQIIQKIREVEDQC